MPKSMSRPKYLASVLAMLFPFSATAATPNLVPAVSASGAPRPPVLATPDFDLAIVRADTKLEQREPARNAGATAAFTVGLKNLGSKAIGKVQVGCKLGPIEFKNLDTSLVLKPNDEHTLTVTTKSDWSEVPEGVQMMNCVAAIVEPLPVKEANTTNNKWSGRVMARPPVVPVTDLLPTSANLRDCASHSLATNAADSCVELEYKNVGQALTEDYYVECTIERTYPVTQAGTTTRIRGVLPMPANGTTKTSLNMGTLALGQHRATCTLDRTYSVPETNETNNQIITSTRIGEPEYDLAVFMVDEWMRAVDSTNAKAKFDVTLSNNGSKDINRASVSCLFGPANEKLPSASTTTTLKSHTRAAVTLFLPNYPKYLGVQPLKCVAHILAPTGVADQASQNNAWSGTIRVP